ncbi:hypothetical protein RHSIM_Rhsim03G0220000 [Rhododendron simsii]|uniref:Uncharacterized protein n=1 Tax=Rhododendron simsii TaxID=118357 RepID=A0A834LT72_RHOSS|nr:hypothetical protein RHSIM_Rhsim03G0220000 [Rhododendron simsii]
MEKKAKFICSVVGFLGLLSAALGFAAEAKRVKASQIPALYLSPCIHTNGPAPVLGLTAALALMVAQIIISITTGCFCCRRGSYQSNSNRRLAIICFAISWITFVHAFLMFLSGAALDKYHGYETFFFETKSCYFVKPGFFAGAALLSLATVVLGIVYYLALDSAEISNNSWGGTAAAPNQGGIAMGHPQFPPPQHPPPQFPPPNAGAPVYVDEDTYKRQQFT